MTEPTTFPGLSRVGYLSRANITEGVGAAKMAEWAEWAKVNRGMVYDEDADAFVTQEWLAKRAEWRRAHA